MPVYDPVAEFRGYLTQQTNLPEYAKAACYDAARVFDHAKQILACQNMTGNQVAIATLTAAILQRMEVTRPQYDARSQADLVADDLAAEFAAAAAGFPALEAE